MREPRRKSEHRRIELTEAALRIIATKGIAALSTRRLADEVGLSSGAIFRHFASLDALLDAVVERVEVVLDSTYPPETLPPMERLERFVEARSIVAATQLGIPRLVLSEQFMLALPKQGSARLAACVEKTRAFVTQCLREGQDSGELRSDLSAEALALIVIGTVQVLALSRAKAGKRNREARAVLGSLLALLRLPAAAPGASRLRPNTRNSQGDDG